MRKILVGVLALAAMIGLSATSAKAYTYVGSWIVGDGPVWTSNPPVYSGRSAAALLFGGTAADYVTSTIDSSVANINFLAFLDGWGNSQYLSNPQPDTFSLTTGTGYNDPVGGPSYSAYVLDHSCFNRYSNPADPCSGNGTQYVNYAFLVDVPEPASMVLLASGILGLGLIRRGKKA